MKKISFLLVLCILFSCERKESNFSKEMIEKLASQDKEKEESVVFIPYTLSDIYLKTSNNKILMTDVNSLYASYKLYYSKKYKSYKVFLETFLDENFVFDEKSKLIFSRKFKVDQKIEKEYSTLGFDGFLEKYSEASSRKERVELNKSNLENEEYFTVKFFLYLNKYDISVDDMHAREFIIKRENSFI